MDLLTYNIFVFVTFWALYTALDFKRHFNTSSSLGDGAADASFTGYFTTVTHTTAGYGDCFPKTALSRFLVTAHLLLVVFGPMAFIRTARSP
jgi:hypothetical protein